MRLTLGQLRRFLYEEFAVYEAFDKEIYDDPIALRQSVLVPKDVKRSIKRWMSKMGLRRNKRSSSK